MVNRVIWTWMIEHELWFQHKTHDVFWTCLKLETRLRPQNSWRPSQTSWDTLETPQLSETPPSAPRFMMELRSLPLFQVAAGYYVTGRLTSRRRLSPNSPGSHSTSELQASDWNKQLRVRSPAQITSITARVAQAGHVGLISQEHYLSQQSMLLLLLWDDSNWKMEKHNLCFESSLPS